MAHILIVDDEISIRKTLKEILEYEKYNVYEAENGKKALEVLQKYDIDLVFSDIKMPIMDGEEFLEEAIKSFPELPIIMISGHGTIDLAVSSIKKGAFDFISKPPDLNRLLITTKNALDKKHLINETTKLKAQIKKSSQINIIGASDAIMDIKSLIDKVAPTDARVLITGENGTGKELIAKMLHQKSERNKQAFIEVNCAAIPAELIESELFGHEKGAFTSAVKQRKGKFELANDGTLFLDEIGDMSLSAQAKVLRALQENKITRVGGDSEIKINVRVLAATNKNLKKEIDNGKFREDLYHRICVINIHSPSLNQRLDDLPLLIDFFLKEVAIEYGTKPKDISKTAIEQLKKKNWRGNIRELKNVVERLVILSDEKITEQDVEKYA